MTHYDEVGNEVRVGDIWVATCENSGRGVYQWMFQDRMRVTALGRTRVTVTTPNYAKPVTVGTECGKVVQAGDGRTLRTWNTVRSERDGVLRALGLLTGSYHLVGGW